MIWIGHAISIAFAFLAGWWVRGAQKRRPKQHKCRPDYYASWASARWRCAACGTRWDNIGGKWVRMPPPNA